MKTNLFQVQSASWAKLIGGLERLHSMYKKGSSGGSDSQFLLRICLRLLSFYDIAYPYKAKMISRPIKINSQEFRLLKIQNFLFF